MGSNLDVLPGATLDDYMTISQAAKYLGYCQASVSRFVKVGILRARKFKGSRARWIRKSDVQGLPDLKAWRYQSLDMKEILVALKTKLHLIEGRMDFLMHVNGLDVSALRDVDTVTLVKLYDEAGEYLEMKRKIPDAQMFRWASVFLQITELELDRMAGPCQDPEPWHPFRELCLLFMKTLRKTHGFSRDEGMQQTYRMLNKALKHLGQCAVIYMEARAARAGHYDTRRLFLLEPQHDSLSRYIAADMGLDRP